MLDDQWVIKSKNKYIPRWKRGGNNDPPPSSQSSNKGRKVKNAQEGECKGSGSKVNAKANVSTNLDSGSSAAAASAVTNADVPVTSAPIKPTDALTKKSTQWVRKTPASNVMATAAPAKTRQDSPRSFTPLEGQLLKEDVGTVDQSNIIELHIIPKTKRDVHVPVPDTSMLMSFHHPPFPVHFGHPNSQIQSHPLINSSMRMPFPIPLPMGIPPHPMQPQGIMHRGQSLNFSSQMGPPLAPQLGNMGMSFGPQYQKHAGKDSGACKKTVKITHPDTHKEVKLDRTDIPKDKVMPPQSQPISSYPQSHPMNYYPNYSNANHVYFPAVGSRPVIDKSELPDISKDKVMPELNRESSITAKGKKKKEKKLQIAASQGTNSPSAISSNDKPLPELNISAKSTTTRGKKKKKMLLKADARETSCDLSTKGPEEKSEEAFGSIKITETSSSITLKQVSGDVSEGEISLDEKHIPIMPEVDGWEDVTYVSTAELETSHSRKQVPQGLKLHGYGSKEVTKIYSRDFLLKFSEQCNKLDGMIFEVPSYTAEAFIASCNVIIIQESDPPSGGKKKKKKNKNMLRKADARGTSCDLFMKGLEEKSEALGSIESTETSFSIDLKQESGDASEREILLDEKPIETSFSIDFKQESGDASEREILLDEKPIPNMPELDEWEDATYVSTAELETLKYRKQVPQGLKLHGGYGSKGMTKIYSRDFLLKFSEQYNKLDGIIFDASPYTADAFIASCNVNIIQESYPPSGKAVDGGKKKNKKKKDKNTDSNSWCLGWEYLMDPRLDCCASFQGEDDNWSTLAQQGTTDMEKKEEKVLQKALSVGILPLPLQSPSPRGNM